MQITFEARSAAMQTGNDGETVTVLVDLTLAQASTLSRTVMEALVAAWREQGGGI